MNIENNGKNNNINRVEYVYSVVLTASAAPPIMANPANPTVKREGG
jgi:hypothetical protein